MWWWIIWISIKSTAFWDTEYFSDSGFRIFRRRFALQRIIARQDQISLAGILIRHWKFRIYPGIRILVIFRTILNFSWSRVSCHPECPDPIRHVTTHYIKMMRQQKLIHSHTLRPSFTRRIKRREQLHITDPYYCMYLHIYLANNGKDSCGYVTSFFLLLLIGS